MFVFPNVDIRFVVGIHFKVSSSLSLSRALVQLTGRNWDDGTQFSNTVTNEIRLVPDGTTDAAYDLSEWTFTSAFPQIFIDIPETTVNGVTSVDFLFSPKIFTFPVNHIRFFADSRQPDGTRTSKWDYLTPPVDLDGFLIRYQLGTNQTWATMTPLHTGSLKTSPYEFNQLAAGTYTIAIKAVDTSGNESSAVYSNVTLGDPRLAGIITDRYPRNEGWPGIKTSCWIDNTGSLIANNTSTWGTGPTTWTAFNKWAMSPVTPIVYEHTVIDLGNAVPFTPLITVTGTGTQTITVATSLDNVTYTAFAAPATVTARYVKVKIEMSGTGTLIIDSMIIYISGQVKDEYIENANVTVTGDRINYLDVGDFRVLPVKSYAVINYANLAFQNLTPVANENWQWTVVEKNITTGVRFNVTKNGALANLPGTARCDFYIKGL